MTSSTVSTGNSSSGAASSGYSSGASSTNSTSNMNYYYDHGQNMTTPPNGTSYYPSGMNMPTSGAVIGDSGANTTGWVGGQEGASSDVVS